jgi:hypothetical protein
MSNSVPLLVSFCLSVSPLPLAAQHQARSPISQKILSAKSVYFEDKTGSDAVGAKALAELKKWGRFRIVARKEQADLVLSLTPDPGATAHVIMDGGETGSVHRDGRVTEDPVPVYSTGDGKPDISLDVIDTKTGEVLWSGSHRGGGLLTGFDSAGARVIKQLERQLTR